MNYTQTFGSTNTLIGVSGIIGVGKSTLTKSLGEIGNYNVLHEPVETNEYLSKINDKQTELLLTYEEYSQVMEKLLTSVFEIQRDLKEILKEQSSLIASQPITRSKKK